MSSCLGSVGVSPYTEDDAAYTMRLTLASRAATSRFTVASTFARLLLRGSSTDFGTDGISSWFRTESVPLQADCTSFMLSKCASRKFIRFRILEGRKKRKLAWGLSRPPDNCLEGYFPGG